MLVQAFVATVFVVAVSGFQPQWYDERFPETHFNRFHTIPYDSMRFQQPIWNGLDYYGRNGAWQCAGSFGAEAVVPYLRNKLVSGVPVTHADVEMLKTKTPLLHRYEIDQLLPLLKLKLRSGFQLQRMELVVLKECLKAKVKLVLPLDTVEAELLKDIIQMKLERGYPLDDIEFQTFDEIIKNRLLKDKAVRPEDVELFKHIMLEKIAQGLPAFEMESEILSKLLEMESIFKGMLPLNERDAQLFLETAKSKAYRGAPVERVEEDAVLELVKLRLENGQPIRIEDRRLAANILKNKLQRNEMHSLPGNTIWNDAQCYRHGEQLICGHSVDQRKMYTLA